MKKINKLYISLFLFVLSLGFILYCFLGDAPGFFKYLSIFLFGVLLALNIFLIMFKNVVKKSEFLEKKVEMWNSISYRVKKAGETSFNKMPLGIIVFNDQFIIEWANNYAKQIFSSELVERRFENLNPDIAKNLLRHLPEFSVSIYERVYHCTHLLRDHVIYLSDITNETNVINKYKQRTLAMGILNLDNLDLTMSTLDAQTKALQMSRLISILTNWSEEHNVCLKGYSEERYMLIMDYQTLEIIMKENFKVIDSVKDYCEKEGLRITVSIGIVCDDMSASDLLDQASEELDLALSRGGNQAIVKKDNEILYFGAKGEAFESRTPAYIRIKTEEFQDLISKYSKVYIMSHRYMDADAFGACLAASKIATSVNVQNRIVFDVDYVDATVKEISDTIKSTYPNINDLLVTPGEAYRNLGDDVLLILVDCQYQKLLIDEKVYKKAKNVAIVDHHRRNTEAINNYNFIYSQPSASSSVELLVEMLEFIDNAKYDISPIEATWMIMGILVDTNNFMFHTTHRTFNVLSMLQSYGAEMAKVQRYLRENVNEYTKKVEFLNNLEVVNGYGIVTCDEEIYERSFIAKVADNVITVSNIKAAFCIGKFSKNAVNISARSLDEENVQVIMEKLGGGGHYTIAATQMYNTTIEEAKQRLLEVLNSDAKEGDNTMKVILVRDVKGKGKTNDILNVPMGHANYLIRNGDAIEASPANIRQLEANALREKELAQKQLEDMQALKVKVNSMVVKVAVKVGASGKLFGSVSTKEVVEKFKEQNGIELDKRKIMLDTPIDALGTYKIPIQLHKDVTATITLYVIEEGAE